MERFYPFEHKKENGAVPADQTKADELPVQGKGRRDGNSPSSVVLHSGNVTERARKITERKEREKNPEKFRKEYASSDRPLYRKENGKKFESGGKETFRKKFDAVNDLRGKRLELRVQENTEYGSFLETEDGKRILLPFAEQTERPEPGAMVSVSIYEDKGRRLTATMREPLIPVGRTGVLTVAAVTKIGVFADNGMPKQVLIPFREMLHTPAAGDSILVYIYLDKSGREAGTMRVYRHLEKTDKYKPDDQVNGFVYEINPELGVFVAVDDRYYGMIPAAEVFEELHYGDRISARVSKIREDGKMDLLLRDKLFVSADKDAERILEALRSENGFLPYADRADNEVIRERFAMSKNQFKRALGWLYKKRLISIDREKDTVTLLMQNMKQK